MTVALVAAGTDVGTLVSFACFLITSSLAVLSRSIIRREFVVDSVFIGGGGCFFSQNSLKVLLNAELPLFAVEEIMNIILSAGKIGHCCQGEMICEEAMIE
jgi:hypothetical protein